MRERPHSTQRLLRALRATRAHLALCTAGCALPAATISAGTVALLSSPRPTAKGVRLLEFASGLAILAIALPMVWPRG